MASEDDPRDKSQGRALNEAFDWVGRVVAVALEMVLPGVAGSWLDGKWGTSFLTPAGFVVGLILGVTHLIVMVRDANARASAGSRGAGSKKDARRNDGE